jgi:hypothetical protein
MANQQSLGKPRQVKGLEEKLDFVTKTEQDWRGIALPLFRVDRTELLSESSQVRLELPDIRQTSGAWRKGSPFSISPHFSPH